MKSKDDLNTFELAELALSYDAAADRLQKDIDRIGAHRVANGQGNKLTTALRFAAAECRSLAIPKKPT